MLTALVPCLDESESLPRLETELFATLPPLGDFEALFIDDGSTDGTGAALDELAKRRPNSRVFHHAGNRGIGASLKTGISQAKGDWLVFLDADLTFHPSFIKGLLEAQKSSGADCVSGSPYLGGMPGVPLGRKLPSLALNAFYRGLFDGRLTSYTPMFRLYRTSDLRQLSLESDGFEVSVEVLVKLLKAGKNVLEVPTPLTVRVAGASKLRRWRELRAHLALAMKLLA